MQNDLNLEFETTIPTRLARPGRPNHVWSYDCVQDRTADGRACRMLNIIDEHSREVLMIQVKRKINFVDVVDALTDLFILRGHEVRQAK